MAKDTYLLDISPGSLSNMYKIKILICCVIYETNTQFTKYQLNDVFQANGTVNYFSFCQAIKELLQTKHILEKPSSSEDKKYLYVTNLGKETAIALKNNVPKLAISKTIAGIENLIKKDRQDKNRTVSIKKQQDGYIVKLVLEETGSNLMDLELFCPTQDLAKKMETEMKSKTTDIYKCILAILGNEHKTLREITRDVENFRKSR